MSYSICRIAKIKATGVTGIQVHDRREKGVSHTNEDIDWDRVKENVDLINQQERFRTVISKRIESLNLPKAIRKDATVMCQCLLTSDSMFFEKMTRSEQTDFFKKGLEFVADRYGKENLVSATIHYDEKTPHMHVNFVPVTADGRLSARDLFSPKQLRTLQDDYNRTCREHGYDLKRGELHSQKEHLSVEEYKVSTRYDEIKTKKSELERIETIDKKANLQAEKGKLTYSTKEVDAIKDQNKSLKVEIHTRDEQIYDLKKTIGTLNKRLIGLENEIKSMEVPLERLKDLESENKALETYIENSPPLKKEMETFGQYKKQAYTIGNRMAEAKNVYMKCIEERNTGIEKTQKIEVKIKECDQNVSDLLQRQNAINAQSDRLRELQKKEAELQGVFKAKQRKEVQSEISEVENVMQGLKDRLKKKYGIVPADIKDTITNIYDKQKNLFNTKKLQISLTDNIELHKDLAIRDYKYYRALSDVQESNLQAISNRRDFQTKLPSYERSNFTINKEDRGWILARMDDKNPNMTARCKENFEWRDEQERLRKINRVIEKSWEMER